MHVTTDIKDLAAAIRAVKPGISKWSNLPVLANAHLEAADGRLTITGTDLDLTVRTSIAATITEPGVALARCMDLGKAVKGKGSIELISADGHVRAVNGITTRVPTSGTVADYPKLTVDSDGSDPAAVTVQADVSALRSVLVAASNDGARPILTGVLFGHDHDRPFVVATDSYRLHLVEMRPAAGWNSLVGDHSQIVPARALRAAAAHIKTGSLAVTFQKSERSSVVIVTVTAADGTTWATRTIEGAYPNFRQLIPGDLPSEVTFPRPLFEDTLRRIAGQVDKKVPVRIGPADGSGLLLSAGGRSVDEVGVEETMPGHAEFTFGADPTYLADAVSGMATCRLKLTDALKPIVFTDVDDLGALHTRLVMPVRI